MAEREAAGRGAGGAGTATKAGERLPGAGRLKEELERYVEARVQLMLEDVGHRMGEGARRLGEAHLGPRGLATAVAKGGRKLGGHLPSGAAALTSTASHARDRVLGAKDTMLDKARDATAKRPGRHDEGEDESPDESGAKSFDMNPDSLGKGVTVIEDIDVGVPVREAYDQWTQFQDFDRFAKGVVGVEQEDDTTTKWHVKIAKSKRRWRGFITEQVPDERIAWTSEGDHATTRGVVTFHPLSDNLTKVLLVLRYYPKGPVERIGGLFRAQGRRARLDLKLYRTFVMMRGEATGGWRGEIHEGEVVREPEEVEAEESEESRAEQEDEGPEERDTEEDEDLEDRYDDEDEEDEEDDWEEDEEEEEDQDEEDQEGEDGTDEVDEDREPDDRYDNTDEEPRPTRRRRG
ncbi:SRPBCC family protein [Streptomyces sp. NPDC006385]|uniref:SRPBCC family protein n=1 Tax=Streptomyces sp. NPDC006385 TaxID=3156761 RepID=UPI0033BBC86E